MHCIISLEEIVLTWMWIVPIAWKKIVRTWVWTVAFVLKKTVRSMNMDMDFSICSFFEMAHEKLWITSGVLDLIELQNVTGFLQHFSFVVSNYENYTQRS